MSSHGLSDFEPKRHPLKAFFKNRGVTQATLAVFCGVRPRHMGEILNGWSPCTPEMNAKLEEAKQLVEDKQPSE